MRASILDDEEYDVDAHECEQSFGGDSRPVAPGVGPATTAATGPPAAPTAEFMSRLIATAERLEQQGRFAGAATCYRQAADALEPGVACEILPASLQTAARAPSRVAHAAAVDDGSKFVPVGKRLSLTDESYRRVDRAALVARAEETRHKAAIVTLSSFNEDEMNNAGDAEYAVSLLRRETDAWVALVDTWPMHARLAKVQIRGRPFTLRQAAETAVFVARTHVQRAVALKALGNANHPRSAEAQDCYRKSLQLDGSDANAAAWHNIAVCLNPDDRLLLCPGDPASGHPKSLVNLSRADCFTRALENKDMQCKPVVWANAIRACPRDQMNVPIFGFLSKRELVQKLFEQIPERGPSSVLDPADKKGKTLVAKAAENWRPAWC